MQIATVKFGTLEVPEDKIISMPSGMLGFPDSKRYVLLEKDETAPFLWYQSVDEPLLSFMIISPLLFMPEFKVDLKPALETFSWPKEGNDFEFYVVVTIAQRSPLKMTANLAGPIVINNQSREAVQMVLYDTGYPYDYSLLNEEA